MEKISTNTVIHYLLSSYVYGISRAEYQLTGRHGVFSRIAGEESLNKACEMMGTEIPLALTSEIFEGIESFFKFIGQAGALSHKFCTLKQEEKRLDISVSECPFQYACRRLLDEGRANLTCFYSSIILSQIRKKTKKIRGEAKVSPGNCQIMFEKTE